jgi:hypothetical protein
MDVILLRKLAWKSTIWFGKYEGSSIQQIYDLQHTQYLRYIYFNYEGISFIDEILIILGIKSEKYSYEIKKPGVDKEKGEELTRIKFNKLCKILHPAHAVRLTQTSSKRGYKKKQIEQIKELKKSLQTYKNRNGYA